MLKVGRGYGWAAFLFALLDAREKKLHYIHAQSDRH
jgi:hypothetical protein